MPIEQVAFVIPADIAEGISSGELIRFGGIVRQANGAIYTHLKEVEVIQSPGSVVAKIFRSPKRVAYCGAFLLVTSAVGVMYSVRRRKVGECVAGLSLAMQAYATAVQEQSMNAGVINGLLEALETVEDLKSRRVSRVIEGAEFQDFVHFVAGYSREFFAKNQVELAVCESERGTEVVDLRQYLESQRSLFDCTV